MMTTSADGAGEGGAAGQVALDAGVISDLSEYSTGVLESFDALATATGVFSSLGWIAVGCGVLVLAISPVLKRMMHGIN